MYKNDDKAFIGFMVCKIYSRIVYFSKWLWELGSYPTLFFFSHASDFDQWPFSKINHSNSEYCPGDLSFRSFLAVYK